MDEFVSTFVRVKAKNEVDIRPSIHGAPDIVAPLAEALAVQAVAMVMHRTCPDCVTMTQPGHRVVTTAPVDRDAMLIPVSFRVRVPPAAYVQAEDDLVAEVVVAGESFAVLPGPPNKEDAHAGPAFAVRTAGEEKRVNVVIDTDALFVDFEYARQGHNDTPVRVKIPVLRVMEPVAANMELLKRRPTPVAEKKRTLVKFTDETAKVAKKAKAKAAK